jgi:hypothetical protein
MGFTTRAILALGVGLFAATATSKADDGGADLVVNVPFPEDWESDGPFVKESRCVAAVPGTCDSDAGLRNDMPCLRLNEVGKFNSAPKHNQHQSFDYLMNVLSLWVKPA